MLRSLAKIAAQKPVTRLARPFSLTTIAWAKQKEGKTKNKTGYRKTTTVKVRKGGMSDQKFRDAVRSLGFDKLAPGVSELGLQNLLTQIVGGEAEVVKYSPETLKKLQTLQFFKNFQYEERFSEPVTLITTNTHQLMDKFVSKLAVKGEFPRVLLKGTKGTGKLTLLAQTYALVSDFEGPKVQLHFDLAQDLRNGTSDYIFNLGTKKYQQPTYTARWIEKIRETNKDALKSLKLLRDVSFVNEKRQKETFKKDLTSLYDFLATPEFGKQDALDALTVFIDELKNHSEAGSVSVVISADDILDIVNEWKTKYRHPDFKPIRTDEFELSDLLLQLLAGELKFAQGGFICATRGDPTSFLTLDVGIGAKEYNPYWKSEKCLFDLALRLLSGKDSLTVFEPQNLLKDDTRVLLSFYQEVNTLHLRDFSRKEKKLTVDQILEPQEKVPVPENEEIFNLKVQGFYSLSGGNIGEIVKATNFLFQ